MDGADLENLDLDTECVRVLSALEMNGGNATTPDVVDSTGLSRQQIHYRLGEMLEPLGLVETEQPIAESPGNTPPKKLSLTEAGQSALDEVEEEWELNRDLAERVGELESQIDLLRDEGMATDSTEETLSEIQTQLDHLMEDVSDLNSRLNRLEQDPLFASEHLRKQLNAALAMSGVSKEFFLKEYGDDVVQQLFDDKQDDLRLLDTSRYTQNDE